MKKNHPNENTMLLIWIQTLIAVAGSLYFSEIKGYILCEYRFHRYSSFTHYLI